MGFKEQNAEDIDWTVNGLPVKTVFLSIVLINSTFCNQYFKNIFNTQVNFISLKKH